MYSNLPKVVYFGFLVTEVLLGGKIAEMIDISLTYDDIMYLDKFSNSTNTKIKLSGKYSSIGIITDKEKNDIKDIINAYNILNENLEIIK